jgi:hypothetical protein
MNTPKVSIKKFLLLTAVGTVVYLAFGWLVFDFILGAYTDHHTTQLPGFKKSEAEFSMPLLVLSCAAYAALMTYIIAVLANVKTAVKGAKTGAVVGVLVAIMADSYWLASSNFYSTVWVAVADVLGAAVSVGVLGWVIALLHGKMRSV